MRILLSCQAVLCFKSSPGKARRLANAFLITLLISTIAPARAAFGQDTPPVYTFQECEQIEEARLRDELNAIAQAVFEPEQVHLKIAEIVDGKWMELNLDAIVDEAVEAGIEKVRSDTGWWERVRSNWSAKELAEKVAIDAFGSPKFVTAVNQLSENISDELVAELRVMTARSASSALLCVQEFIGDRFSQTMAALLEEQIQERIDETVIDPDAGDATVLDIVTSHPKLLGGVAVIIGTQIAKRLAQKVTQKIAGRIIVRILGKLATAAIPIVGWIVGGGLIIWDVIKAGEGALPQIEDALKGEDVKAEIRRQIAQEVEAEFHEDEELNPRELARSIANTVYSQWQDFRRKFARVLELAKTDARFQTILNNTTTEQVAKLANLVAVADEKLEPDRLGQLIATGQFERIFFLPREAFEILRVSGDPEVVIAWADLAGELIVQVVEAELYRVASPSDFKDPTDLERILALEDADLVQKLMLFEGEERDVLLGLATEQTRQALATLATDDISWLAAYVAQLPTPRDRNLLVDRVLREPALMAHLKSESVRRTVLESPNVQETLDFLATWGAEEAAPATQLIQAASDTKRVIDGDVPWALYWSKYGTVQNGLYLLVGLAILYLLGRIFLRCRRPEVNVTVNIPERRDSEEDGR